MSPRPNITSQWIKQVEQLQEDKTLMQQPAQYHNRLQGLRQDLNNNLSVFNQQMDERRISLDNLAREYQDYPNVSAVLNNFAIDTTFNRVHQSIDSYRNEVQTIEDPTKGNFPSSIKPYTTGIADAQKKLEKWATETRDFANKQIDGLSSAQAQLK